MHNWHKSLLVKTNICLQIFNSAFHIDPVQEIFSQKKCEIDILCNQNYGFFNQFYNRTELNIKRYINPSRMCLSLLQTTTFYCLNTDIVNDHYLFSIPVSLNNSLYEINTISFLNSNSSVLYPFKIYKTFYYIKIIDPIPRINIGLDIFYPYFGSIAYGLLNISINLIGDTFDESIFLIDFEVTGTNHTILILSFAIGLLHSSFPSQSTTINSLGIAIIHANNFTHKIQIRSNLDPGFIF